MNKKIFKKNTLKEILASKDKNNRKKKFKAFAIKLCKRLLKAKNKIEKFFILSALICVAFGVIYEDDVFFKFANHFYNDGNNSKKSNRK